MWDERYSQPGFVYGTEPNDFLSDWLPRLEERLELSNRSHAPRILFPADGEGRNGVYAAARGWEVTSFDTSRVGRQKALDLAREKKVSLRFELADALHFESSVPFDCVGLFFAHFPPENRQAIHQRMAGLLKPGGYLLLEAFHPRQLPLDSGGPKKEALLYTEGILRADFQQLDIEILREQKRELAEGPYHDGPAEVIQLLARRP